MTKAPKTLPGHYIGNRRSIELSTRYAVAMAVNRACNWSFSGANNERSTIKTHYLHSGIKKVIEEALGNFESPLRETADFTAEKFGHRTGGVKRSGKEFPKAMGKTFSADLFIKPKSLHQRAFVISAKMPTISINKNNTNYMNTVLGEAMQFFGCAENSDSYLVFFNIRPRQSFLKNGDKLTVERPNYPDMESNTGTLHPDFQNCILENVLERIRIVNIYFDWAPDIDLHTYQSTEDFAVDIENHFSFGLDINSIEMHGLTELVELIAQEYCL